MGFFGAKIFINGIFEKFNSLQRIKNTFENKLNNFKLRNKSGLKLHYIKIKKPRILIKLADYFKTDRLEQG